MLAAIAFAWFLAPQQLIDGYETLMLIGGSTTFFWVGGLLDGFLLLQKKADPLRSVAILRRALSISFLFAATSAIACGLIGCWFYPELGEGLVIGFAGYLFLETAGQIFPYFFIGKDRPLKLLALGLFSSLGYCSAIGVSLVMDWGLEAMVAGLFVVAACKLVWLLVEVRKIDAQAGAYAGVTRELFMISLPLILATLLSQSAVYVDGFLVQRFFPDAFVDFRYGAKEFPLVLLLANAMSIVRAGEIAGAARTGEVDAALRGLRSSSTRLIWTLFPVCIGLMMVSGPMFRFFFVGRFPMAVPVFDLFLLLAIPRLMFPQSVVRGFQKTSMMSLSAGVELVLNVGLSLLLMQYYGIAGIAAGTVLSFFGEKIVILSYTQFKLGISWHRYASVPLWLGSSVLLVFVWLCKYVLMPELWG
jgi:O-antigen/teichoic acid export membrane protein